MNIRNSTYIIALTFIIGLIAIIIQFRSFNTQFRQDLTQYLNVVQSSIDPNYVTSLSGNQEDNQNPNYEYLQKQLTRLANSYPNIRYLYLMRQVSDKIIFLVDTQSNKFALGSELATPGELYTEALPSLKNIFLTGKNITVGPETDKWGTFISALGPIYSSDNQIIALVGADVDSSDWTKLALSGIKFDILLFLVIICLELVIFRFFGRFSSSQLSLNYLANILQTSNDAIYSYDIDGVIKSWNQGAQKLYGYTPSEAIGHKITDLIYLPKNQDEFKQVVSMARKNETLRQRKTIRYTKSHQKITILLTESYIFQSGVVVGFSAVAKDITRESFAEDTINNRNHELEELNRLMVDRELKMIELKKQIKELSKHK